MKSYTYVAKSKNGKEVRGTINAEDVKDFMAQAKAKNLEIKGYEEKDVKDSKSIRKFKTEELSFCCRQLAAMLTSGLTLVKALDILSKEQPTEQAKEVWQSIYENVQKGESFSSSLEQYRGVFPEFLISMVGAGESSGSLDTIMQRMSDHYQKEQKMNNTIKGAMTYPIILGFLCIVIIIAMFTFIMPTFAGLYESPDDMPAFTKAMMAFSDSLVHFWFVYIIVIGAIVFGITYIMKIPSTRLKFDKLIIKGPGFGPLVVKIYTARFARTLSSLYSSGIPMVECLQRSSSILGNRYIDELFENVVDEVKQGETLSSSIQRTEIFDSMFCSIIFVGEEAGALDTILGKTAEYYDEEADSAVARLVAMLEPVMIIIMGVAVCMLLLAVFPALYGSFDAIAA
ncbi:MAG: type II secretion system F family protein [Oscillospiraceae bacterium]|jgi:type IV pilus assembly protein PilC|nr:type II secretion system F family protein [Oscillospiraceae bacterium]MBR1898103.1 type II secretion system F family protein [Oscillospiraceae bacterium]